MLYSITSNYDPIHDLISNLHTKIATQLNKIISDSDIHTYTYANVHILI